MDRNPPSSELQALLDYLRNTGYIRNFRVSFAEDTYGEYDLDNQTISVEGSNERERESAILYETVHALAKKPERSNTAKMYNLWKKLGYFDRKNVVFPVGTEKGQAWNPLIEKHEPYGMTEPWYNRSRFPQALNDTQTRRFRAVTKAIPKGESWSGLKPQGELSRGTSSEETHAYYFTEPGLAVPQKTRVDEFTRFLLDYDVPIDIIRNLKTRMEEKVE